LGAEGDEGGGEVDDSVDLGGMERSISIIFATQRALMLRKRNPMAAAITLLSLR